MDIDNMNGKYEEISRIEGATPDFVRQTIEANRSPVIFAGLVKGWKAVHEWSLEYLKSRFGQVPVSVILRLPTHGAPYDQKKENHESRMTFGEFLDYLLSGSENKSCYMPEKAIELFPGAERDLDFDRFTPLSENDTYTRLWVGSSGTRSGLHFDLYDNFLGQIFGTKRVLLASPGEIRYLYPYINYVQKSQIDPDNIDLDRFPKYPNASMKTGILRPGDILFIPKLWWHYLQHLENSITANYWHGSSVSLGGQLKTVLACSPRFWWRTAADFFWLGLLNRPYKSRLLAEAPTGRYLYEQSIGFRWKSK